MPDETARTSAIADLMRAGREMSRLSMVFRYAIADRLGLTVSDLECLDYLADSGSASAGQIAERTNLTTGAVTSMLRRLQQAGYVTAERDPADRRRVIVTLRPERVADLERPYERFAERAERLVEGYSAEEVSLLVRHYDRMQAMYLAELDRLRDDDPGATDGSGSTYTAAGRRRGSAISVAPRRPTAQDHLVAPPDTVLSDLREAWRRTLADSLLGLYLHGSLVAGDFDVNRSDLDLLAVLASDPDEKLLDVLADLHADLDRRHPQWAGRLEVEYVSLDAVRAVPGRDHMIARISPGESLHLLPATTHRVVTWAAVHDHGRTLLGPPAGELLPAVEPGLVRAALRDHVRDWPAWVLEMTPPGAQSYAVLTLCRAYQRLHNGRQLSKRQAAEQTAAALPRWADLIVWARDWWYGSGQDTDPGRFDDVRAFVHEVSAAILAEEPDRR
ncbi:aminoglycoside adenylyltransferase domain-containing protein [Micromonospora chalcea]|uniref:aminoglycoside adenylyltransferase domain-containing protein n=1 Tax=Micromonospora TaxID=1873 RepID=UPI000E33136F|nr:aminoglycoside adenylyltransferase domain-containing protein [Micromonospora sp. B006]AXO37141.1 hypothetical protein MicB006_4879 [Micromonospora sp. B006]